LKFGKTKLKKYKQTYESKSRPIDR
jgi:hypothetical protein